MTGNIEDETNSPFEAISTYQSKPQLIKSMTLSIPDCSTTKKLLIENLMKEIKARAVEEKSEKTGSAFEIDISLNSNSYRSITKGFISSNKIAIEKFFLMSIRLKTMDSVPCI